MTPFERHDWAGVLGAMRPIALATILAAAAVPTPGTNRLHQLAHPGPDPVRAR